MDPIGAVLSLWIFDMTSIPMQTKSSDQDTGRLITLKALAERLDADRSTVRRWLKDAGVAAIAMGDGPRCAIRYRLADVEQWLRERPAV